MRKLVLILLLISIVFIIGCEGNEEAVVEITEETEVMIPVEEVKLESLQSIKEKIKNRSLSKSEYGREDPFALISITDYIKTKRKGISRGPRFHLDGIIWDVKRPLAIIDGKTVEQGDKIGDKVIEKIDEDSVTLFDGKNRIKLRL